MLKPRNLEKQKQGVILEFKVISTKEDLDENKVQEKLQEECTIALKQIIEKKYISAFKNAGVENILKIGVAFL